MYNKKQMAGNSSASNLFHLEVWDRDFDKEMFALDRGESKFVCKYIYNMEV